ncbi:MAG TPA: isocitrate lyase/phosphoenolpyruvate mutase family protein [Lichenihabitans sp.]|jgi:2-methylisocitrate lyase-like PEP mutase family enzyme|nr:isocitrate lyase/phosphoenolpyruvate mutase family protein [Lichenihabitans sp.]
MTAQSNATLFRDLQAKGRFLALPNAWDAGSAAYLASLGAKAAATSSAALAWSHGYPDGERLPRDLLLASVAEVTRAVSIPVSVDTETGYGGDPAEVGETIARLVGAGAVGINIEDGLRPAEETAARIAAARAAATREGVALFINARTDLWLKPLVADAARRDEAIRRGRLYAEAGADGFFLPRLAALDDVKAIAAAVPLRPNLMAVPGLPKAAQLREAGATRVSLGVMTLLKAFGGLRQPVQTFLEDGDLGPFFEDAAGFPEINGLFA